MELRKIDDEKQKRRKKLFLICFAVGALILEAVTLVVQFIRV